MHYLRLWQNDGKMKIAKYLLDLIITFIFTLDRPWTQGDVWKSCLMLPLHWVSGESTQMVRFWTWHWKWYLWPLFNKFFCFQILHDGNFVSVFVSGSFELLKLEVFWNNRMIAQLKAEREKKRRWNEKLAFEISWLEMIMPGRQPQRLSWSINRAWPRYEAVLVSEATATSRQS